MLIQSNRTYRYPGKLKLLQEQILDIKGLQNVWFYQTVRLLRRIREKNAIGILPRWVPCPRLKLMLSRHYSDAIMGAMASQITSLTIVYPNVYSGADQRKHRTSALLAFVRGIHRWPVNSPNKWPVTRKMFPFDDVIIEQLCLSCCHRNGTVKRKLLGNYFNEKHT